MKIPEGLKTARCDVCGKACVPMTRGNKFFHPALGKRITVVVCMDCDRTLGDFAYLQACEHVDL